MPDRALRSGATQPKELRRYLNKGLQLYCCADLHAKFFLFDKTAIVGSANVSELSYIDLHEAALLTRDPKAVTEAREFIEDLPKDIVDREFLKRAEEIYKPPQFPPGVAQGSIDAWVLRLMRRVGPVNKTPRHGYFIDLRSRSKAVWDAYLRADKTGAGTEG
jgi:phosphatidylserine/phosphatidylglycerophosphate/cardiolipin synthase-like enzyme